MCVCVCVSVCVCACAKVPRTICWFSWNVFCTHRALELHTHTAPDRYFKSWNKKVICDFFPILCKLCWPPQTMCVSTYYVDPLRLCVCVYVSILCGTHVLFACVCVCPWEIEFSQFLSLFPWYLSDQNMLYVCVSLQTEVHYMIYYDVCLCVPLQRYIM